MGARGPAKGSGGRPRTKAPASPSKGYQMTTVGPPGKGTQQYTHRVVAHGGTVAGTKQAPKVGQGTTKVVDHKDGSRSNNSKSNLRMVSRSVNAKKR